MSRPGTIELEVRRSGSGRFGRYLALGALAALVSGCMSGTYSYYWGSYEDSVHGMCLKEKGYDSGKEFERLTREIERTEASRWRLVPPGKYMYVGYLHYLAGDREAAKSYFLKEKEWFPESARFVDGMLERMK
ncbi:MAG: DUF4810 domain-containing protein [Planctomycetota bacterium]|jgi:hypothetical protein